MIKIGIERIDNDHEEILKDLKIIKEDLKLGNVINKDILPVINDHVVRHFRDEEEYMKSIELDLDFINNHRAIHREILKTFIEFLINSSNLHTNDYNKFLLDFIVKFEKDILEHIEKEDCKIKI